jgi:hypothetical protein
MRARQPVNPHIAADQATTQPTKSIRRLLGPMQARPQYSPHALDWTWGQLERLLLEGTQVLFCTQCPDSSRSHVPHAPYFPGQPSACVHGQSSSWLASTPLGCSNPAVRAWCRWQTGVGGL